MKRALLGILALAGVTTAVVAQPTITLLEDARVPAQVRRTAEAKRYLYLLLRANQMETSQLVLKTVDVSDKRAARTRLPALAVSDAQGTPPRVIPYGPSPQHAAELAFEFLQKTHPDVIHQTALQTGANVTSTPAGAALTIDGRSLGETPAEIQLRAGQHRMSLSHPDCLPWQGPFSVKGGETTELNVVLTAQRAQLRVESGGPPLLVALDGVTTAVPAPWTAELGAGQHHLRATAQGYLDLETDVHLSPSMRTVIHLTPRKARVRVGVGDFQVTGYTAYSTPFGANDPEPYEVTLDPQKIYQSIESSLLQDPLLLLQEKEQPHDCALEFEVRANREVVIGTVKVLDAQGRTLDTFTSKRAMPFLTFDEQGSAGVRAREVADELGTRLRDSLSRLVQPMTGPQPDAPTPEQVRVEEVPMRP